MKNFTKITLNGKLKEQVIKLCENAAETYLNSEDPAKNDDEMLACVNLLALLGHQTTAASIAERFMDATKADNSEVAYCEDTVKQMEEDFRLGGTDAAYEIEEVKGAISNERIWLKGSSTEEEVLGHAQNIADLSEYLARLETEYFAKRAFK